MLLPVGVTSRIGVSNGVAVVVIAVVVIGVGTGVIPFSLIHPDKRTTNKKAVITEINLNCTIILLIIKYTKIKPSESCWYYCI